ncbi:MurR/RpiR family transcriptional regulator [Rhodovulum sp. 12E13]|uniref:MurR/RpiR family transcriptional regulator n=1 Tax=Rhodovulum sp. 12E13 TaxID=2203891 RepID=UPI000E1480A3|nr:MurR/RpiR family transcriptional regulator [Rhodovulum sp. 12E13]RDC71426.1 MurR/RpiR family transcriptional regulator [Rhodovulum sp. 12E13]
MKTGDVAAPTLTERLNATYGELTASERKIVDALRDRPGEIAVMTGKELAARSGVSTATVSRLFQRLGYASYEAARRAARELRASGSIFHLFETGARDSPAPERLVAGHLAEEARAMEASFSMLDPTTVREIAAALAGARRVWCVGFRNSHVLAEYAATLLASVRPDVFVLAHGGRSLAERVAGIEAGDVAIVFGMRRRMAHFAPLLQAIGESGARTALLADRSLRLADPSRRPDWTLICAIETEQPIDSFAGPFAIVRLLSLQTLRQRDTASRETLERVERLHGLLGELE